MRTISAFFAASGLWALAFAPAGAAPPAPPVMPLVPSATRSFTGHAHGDLKVTFGGSTIDLTAHATLAQRDNLARFDITLDRGGIALLPPGGITLVVDRSAGTLTAWNDAAKLYYVQSLTPPPAPPAPAATPAPRASLPARSPLADLDVLALNVQLNGHSTIAGFATTGIIATIDYRKKGAIATAHVHATVDLADDFAWFPVTLNATIDPAMSGVTGALTYAIDDVVQTEPPLAAFAVPSTYQKAATILRVISPGGGGLPAF